MCNMRNCDVIRFIVYDVTQGFDYGQEASRFLKKETYIKHISYPNMKHIHTLYKTYNTANRLKYIK